MCFKVTEQGGMFEILHFLFILKTISTKNVYRQRLRRNYSEIGTKSEMKLMISEQLKFFLAKYLTSKSGGDYTEIELWIQPNPALAPGSSLKYLVISIIWSFFFFTIRWRWLQWWRWSWFYNKPDPFANLLSRKPSSFLPPLCFLENDAIFCDLDILIPHTAACNAPTSPFCPYSPPGVKCQPGPG